MQENKDLTLDVKFQIKDIWRYNMYIAYRTVFSRLVVVAGLTLVAWLIYKGMNRTVTLDVYLSQNILYIALAILMLVTKVWRIWTITATQMQSPIFSGKTHYRFSQTAIYMQVSDLEDTVSWETYAKIVETKHDFRLFVDEVQAQIIPKHNMTNDQLEAFRALVRGANPPERYRLK